MKSDKRSLILSGRHRPIDIRPFPGVGAAIGTEVFWVF